MQKIKARVVLVLLVQLVIVLWAAVGSTEGFPVASPNIIDAPRHKDDSIPSAIAGNPRPLLDGDAKMIIYDLAATITDEGFDAMESTNIGFLWNPLAAYRNKREPDLSSSAVSYARAFVVPTLPKHTARKSEHTPNTNTRTSLQQTPVRRAFGLDDLLVDYMKAGPIVRLPAPAFAHQIVHGKRCVFRATKHITFLHELDYLLVGHTVVRLHGEREYLPQAHTVRPHIGLDRVLVVQDAFQRHPAYRDGIVLVTLVVILQVDFV
uniref:Uncharacterized protein n=1 Tax=Anopheles culicifacies TaxID=139723 RepID=A0A182MJZ0_9DIPT